MALKFYTSVAKWLKVKARKFWRLMPMLIEVTGEKLEGRGGRGGGVFSASPILGSTTKESYQFVNFIKNII